MTQIYNSGELRITAPNVTVPEGEVEGALYLRSEESMADPGNFLYLMQARFRIVQVLCNTDPWRDNIGSFGGWDSEKLAVLSFHNWDGEPAMAIGEHDGPDWVPSDPQGDCPNYVTVSDMSIEDLAQGNLPRLIFFMDTPQEHWQEDFPLTDQNFIIGPVMSNLMFDLNPLRPWSISNTHRTVGIVFGKYRPQPPHDLYFSAAKW